jgi:hypothetical protein
VEVRDANFVDISEVSSELLRAAAHLGVVTVQEGAPRHSLKPLENGDFTMEN